jgi:hypothetical protein
LVTTNVAKATADAVNGSDISFSFCAQVIPVITTAKPFSKRLCSTRFISAKAACGFEKNTLLVAILPLLKPQKALKLSLDRLVIKCSTT